MTTDDIIATSQQISETEYDLPACGLYIVLPPTTDHNKQAFQLGQALHAANRFSNYHVNRHVVIYHPAAQDGNVTEVAQSYFDVCARNGFIFLVGDDAKLARDVGADGVLSSSIAKASEARKLMDETAIIGLRCATLAMAKSAHDHELDFVSVYSDKSGDPLLDIINWWTTATDNPIAAEGPFTPENCHGFVRAGTTFIDSTHHIWTHPSGNIMQGVVNMLDAFERHKLIRKAVN